MNHAGEFRDLHRLARMEGIQTSYTDMAGREITASPDTLRLLLEKFGHSLAGAKNYQPALRLAETSRWKTPLPEVQALTENTVGVIKVRQSASPQTGKALLATCLLESGEKKQIVLRPIGHGRSHEVDGKVYLSRSFLLPPLPRGYHQLALEAKGQVHTCLLICAPSKLYHSEQSQNQWGLFAPLYSIHSDTSWGAGNFSDWEKLLKITMQAGGSIVSGLPILGAFLGDPVVEPSPYSPASRLFWNEFYLDITSLPELQSSSKAKKLIQSKVFMARLREFQISDLVDYPREMDARRQVLELLAQEFFTGKGQRQNQLREYLKARPEAEDYAAFRAACDQAGKPWQSWGPAQQKGKLAPGKDYSKSDFEYHLYSQWQAQEQIDRLIKTGREGGAELYLDLPLGVHPYGYDAWRERESFAIGVNAGCPPDPCFTRGQDWGFSPLDPKNMRKNRYDYLIRFFRFQMRHTGLLRVDHVMGLHRLYWIPQGSPAAEGAYVQYPAEELYAILALESHRFKTTMVGENLGTVPPQVNRAMDKYGMRRMYVMQYEIQPKQPPLNPPERTVVASLNTHDMPPFAAFEKSLDVDDRRKLGLLNLAESLKEKATRDLMCKQLRIFLRKKKFLAEDDRSKAAITKASLRYLAQSKAETVLVNFEDLWGELKSQNVPGTSSERPNWKRKMKFSLEQLEANQSIQSFLSEVNQLRAKGIPDFKLSVSAD